MLGFSKSFLVLPAATVAAVLLAGAVAAAPPAPPAPAAGAPLVEQIRRCPPGYRKTMTGCARIRPRWWELLIL
jgi:hypothetical protein